KSKPAKTIKDLQTSAYQKLVKHVWHPEFEVDTLLGHVLGQERTWLYAHPEQKVKPNQQRLFQSLVTRRIKREPFAYLTGSIEFFGQDFLVNKDVLVPRPETELLVFHALDIIANEGIKTFVDIGTGSGAILLSVATKAKGSLAYFGTDISTKALAVTKKNKQRLVPKKNITFIKGDLLKPLEKLKIKHPLLVAANLPYLKPAETKKKQLSYEPMVALTGGKAGLELIYKLIAQFKEIALPGDSMVLEIGAMQAKAIKKYVKLQIPKAKVEITKDYSSFDRNVIIKI
ncbi:MAG TPA: peptide chain release factor N(5)-glutamine methyltransferase, partial [Flavobacterium sp.]|nr:peptide chain release factor N(5)-glutamine methyltransferase [Flavobacterium sp.]